jgi:Nucleotidyltransferase domain
MEVDRSMVDALVRVPGILGVVLGGSRARGDHTPESDTDLGLYYRAPLDTAALGEVARRFGGPHAAVTEPGGWGPWVDGGGWLTVDGAPVDWIYRDLDRVTAEWARAEQGRYAFHHQAGHPLGVAGFSYPGELALGRVLADPTGEVATLQAACREYPPALARALVDGLWEAGFLVGVAGKAVSRADRAYVSGCLFRLVGVLTHALHGAGHRWLVNEKGAVAAAAAIPGAPADFRARAEALFTAGTHPDDLAEALDAAADLARDTAAACAAMLG